MPVAVTVVGSGALKNATGTPAVTGSFALVAGDVLVVCVAEHDNAGNGSRLVSWNGQVPDGQLDVPTGDLGDTFRVRWLTLAITSGIAGTSPVFYNTGGATGAVDVAVIAFKVTGLVDPLSVLSTGEATGTSSAPAASSDAAVSGNYVALAAVAMNGPSGDTPGTWGDVIDTDAGSVGTSGGSATGNLTLHAGYANVVGASSAVVTASKTGMTSRSWRMGLLLLEVPTGAALAGVGNGTASAAGDLTTQIGLAGALTASATLSGQLRSAAALVAGVSAPATAQGALTTQIRCAAAAAGQASVSAALSTTIRLRSVLVGTTAVAGTLSDFALGAAPTLAARDGAIARAEIRRVATFGAATIRRDGAMRLGTVVRT